MNIAKKDINELLEAKTILAKFCHKYYKVKEFREEIELLFNAKYLITDAYIHWALKKEKKGKNER